MKKNEAISYLLQAEHLTDIKEYNEAYQFLLKSQTILPTTAADGNTN